MKNYLSFILFFLFFFLSAQNKKNVKIFWNEDRTLSWKDFKGKTETSCKDAAALSFCGIQYKSCENEGNKKYTYQVSSFFVPALSWGRVKTDIILEHEQLHFDIAELYARKLRKAFSEADILPKDSQHEIYKPLFEEYVKIQKLYDKETQHGILQEINKEWQNKVFTELKYLNAYKKEEVCY